jgi:hypothetical protein
VVCCYDACRRFLDSLDASARLERPFVGEDLERRAFGILINTAA